MDQKAHDHFKKARRQMNKANEELYKPKEDVVSFLVCKNSLNAIENYLKGYLSKRGFDTKEAEHLIFFWKDADYLTKNSIELILGL